MEDDYYFQIDDESKDDRLFVLIIYDIVNNSRRTKFAKLLLGYGFRIQKSAFEAVITNHEIPSYINEKEDSVRVYQIKGTGNVTTWGPKDNYNVDDVIIV